MQNTETNQSEIARLRQRIALECAAGWQGLYGLADGEAKHVFITAKLHGMEKPLQQLSGLVGEDQATNTLYEIYNTVASDYKERARLLSRERDALACFFQFARSRMQRK